MYLFGLEDTKVGELRRDGYGWLRVIEMEDEFGLKYHKNPFNAE